MWYFGRKFIQKVWIALKALPKHFHDVNSNIREKNWKSLPLPPQKKVVLEVIRVSKCRVPEKAWLGILKGEMNFWAHRVLQIYALKLFKKFFMNHVTKWTKLATLFHKWKFWKTFVVRKKNAIFFTNCFYYFFTLKFVRKILIVFLNFFTHIFQQTQSLFKIQFFLFEAQN